MIRSPAGRQSWCQLEPKWHVITIMFSKSRCCKCSPGVTHLHRPWTKSWSTWQTNRQESWIASKCCCSDKIKKRNGKIVIRRQDREKRKDWRWKEVGLFVRSSLSTPFSSCSSSQPCCQTSFSTIFTLMQDYWEIWACCFGSSGSSAHRDLNFHPLLMLYSVRRQSELFQVTQNHRSVTTEYAQCIKGGTKVRKLHLK